MINGTIGYHGYGPSLFQSIEPRDFYFNRMMRRSCFKGILQDLLTSTDLNFKKKKKKYMIVIHMHTNIPCLEGLIFSKYSFVSCFCFVVVCFVCLFLFVCLVGWLFFFF